LLSRECSRGKTAKRQQTGSKQGEYRKWYARSTDRNEPDMETNGKRQRERERETREKQRDKVTKEIKKQMKVHDSVFSAPIYCKHHTESISINKQTTQANDK